MSDSIDGYNIFFPQYKKGKQGLPIFPGTILEHAHKLGIEVDSECGGQGICGRCVVRIDPGAEALNSPTAAEKALNLGKNQRLACQAQIIKPANIRVFVKSTGEYSILSEGLHRQVDIDPFVYTADNRVWWRSPQGDRELGEYAGNMYGLAVDVGTTTLVAQIVDLQSGHELATVARRNPQSAYGDDVISRIDHTMRHSDGRAELQATIITALNEIIQHVADEYGISATQIYEAVVVGNSTMRNLFFGLEVASLGVIPFEAPDKAPVNVKASELGLEINPSANVYGPALIGGHAGADCLADILACGLYQAQRPSMLIDIGTNGEVAMGNKDRIMTASCAAGGAYEGATVSSGTGAIDGAISNIWMEDNQVSFETIGGKPPTGICGSGLIDLLAELLRSGIMTRKAKLAKDFVVTDGISLWSSSRPGYAHQVLWHKSG